MRDILEAAVRDWITDSKKAEARHGFVTDGNHSFFKDGTLLATCVFNTTILSWVPVLLTWIHKQDQAHHLDHFLRLFNQVFEVTQRTG